MQTTSDKAQRHNAHFRIPISIVDLVMRGLEVEMLKLREREIPF